MEDGRWKMEDGRWKMEDGRWKMEDGRWKMEDGSQGVKVSKCWTENIMMSYERHFFTSLVHHFFSLSNLRSNSPVRDSM